MTRKILLLSSFISCAFLVSAQDNKVPNTSNQPQRRQPYPLEFRECKTKKPLGDTSLTGEYDGHSLILDFSDFEGTAQVKCKDLVTGDQCTYSTSANGTSYQYIGEVTGVRQITVTTAESSYECITVVE